MTRMLVALAIMKAARWAIVVLSPVRVGGLEGNPPFAYHRAGACLALVRLRATVQAWATPAG